MAPRFFLFTLFQRLHELDRPTYPGARLLSAYAPKNKVATERICVGEENRPFTLFSMRSVSGPLGESWPLIVTQNFSFLI